MSSWPHSVKEAGCPQRVFRVGGYQSQPGEWSGWDPVRAACQPRTSSPSRKRRPPQGGPAERQSLLVCLGTWAHKCPGRKCVRALDTDRGQTDLLKPGCFLWGLWLLDNSIIDVCVCVCVRTHTHACTPSCLTHCDPQTGAHQTLLSVEFPRQQHLSELPFPSPRDLPDSGIKPRCVSPAPTGGFFTTSATSGRKAAARKASQVS